MKRAATLLLLAAATATSAWAQPELSVDKALKIANGYLKEHDRKGTYIKSITLDPTSLARNKYVWSAMWGAPVQIDDTKRESGIQIEMDGSVARYTEQTGATSNTPGTVGIPAHRVELLKTHNRRTRPSILDLKR